MDNMFMIAGIISIVYFIVKFLEMRFLIKDNKPMKTLLRESLIVFFSVIMGLFLMDQLKMVKKTIVNGSDSTNVFTGKPDF
jgi:hypothetical protein